MSTHGRHLETLAVHAGMDGLAEGGSHVPPIDLSTTNPLPSVEEGGEAYEALATGHNLATGQTAVYQRLWQPGVARFEDALAELEGTTHAVAFASGMAALSACLIASVGRGRRHVVALRPLYGGTDHVLATGLLGTHVTWCESTGEVVAAIGQETGLVVLETPANPTCELVDVEAVVAAAGDVPVLVDNTFATPVLQQPARQGARLVLHSATKFLGGHGDVVGGVVACDEEWAASLRQVRALTGGILHPLAAYLLHRGLRTLPVRVRAQQASAAALANRLSAHDAVREVHYPGATRDPYGVLGRQMHGTGSILALDLAGGYDAAATFVESCDLATHAVSLGGVDTLVQHPASLTHRPVAPDARPGAGVVRISVGLEHVDDLTVDLLQALDKSLTRTPGSVPLGR
jgi:cystathionine beta-lyase/cystathionine gamma-synthase